MSTMSTRTDTDPYYRVSLTAANIAKIMSLVESLPLATDPDAMDLLVRLAPMYKKITAGVKQPDYVPTPRPDIMEQLGMAETPPAMSFGTDRVFSSKEEYWEWCYNKYLAEPIDCTKAITEAAKEHMYLYDLMTPEQVTDFEANGEQ